MLSEYLVNYNKQSEKITDYNRREEFLEFSHNSILNQIQASKE